MRVLCPALGAATCAACAATGQGIKYCCSLGHEGHRLVPAAQRAGARALRAWLQAPQQVHRPAPPPQARFWAPEGGSRRGAYQRMSRRRRSSACCCRQYWGGGIGRHESAPPPPTTSHRAGGPLLGLSHLFPTLPGTLAPTAHGDMGGEGRAAGGWVSHSPSHGRTASVALALCLLGGGGCGHPRWLRRRPRLHCPPPPLQLWARLAAGAGGKDGGARALRTFLAPSRQGGSPPPPARRSPPPPPPPSVGGQDRHKSAAVRHGGGQGSAWGRPSRAPLAAQGCDSPSAAPGGGGLLSLGFTRQVQSSGGGGGAQPPTAAPAPVGVDEGAHSSSEDPTQDRGPGPSVAPRYAGGGGGGGRALYICIQLYIDELSPANPLIPSIALASRT